MKSTAFILSALAAIANAAIFTNSEINPVPGEPFELTWSGATGPVTILLKDGEPTDLQTVETLASGATGGSLTVTLDPADYPPGEYAFEIVDGGESNYSKQFAFAGTGSPKETTDSPTASPSATATETDEETTASPTASATDDEETASSTSSSRATRTTSSTDSTDTSVPGAAGRVSSPLALILVTIAAMVYFN